MRGQACPLQHTGGPAVHLRAGRPRSQEHPLRSAPCPGTAGGSPASTHRWACGPLAGGSPALPGTPAPLGAFPGTAGGSPASTLRWACGPLAGGSPALPGTPAPLSAFPWERGRLARLNPPVGLRPTCGRAARAPRDTRSARRLALGPRAARPLQLTGGPAAHLRAGRPRSQGHPLRSAPFPGPRAARPLQHSGGPAAHLWAGRPRSQGHPLRSAPCPGPRAARPLQLTGGPAARAGGPPALPGTPAPLSAFPGTAGGSPALTHRWACGPLAGGSPALPGTPAPLSAFPGTAGGSPASTLRWACGPLAGGSPALPGTPAPLSAFPRDRGRLARFNSPVGLPAHLRAGRPPSQGHPLRLAPFPGTAGGSPASTHGWACRPLAGEPPALPGTPAPLGAFPGTAGGSPASTLRWACGPLAGGSPALPGTPAPLGAFPGDAPTRWRCRRGREVRQELHEEHRQRRHGDVVHGLPPAFTACAKMRIACGDRTDRNASRLSRPRPERLGASAGPGRSGLGLQPTPAGAAWGSRIRMTGSTARSSSIGMWQAMT